MADEALSAAEAAPSWPRAVADRGSTRTAMVWTSLASLSLPASVVISGPIVARALGPEDRGALAAITAPVSLLVLIASVGVIEALIYFCAGRLVTRATSIRYALAAGLITGVGAALVLEVFAGRILRSYPGYVRLLQVLALGVPVLVCLTNLRGVVQGAGAYRLANTSRVVAVVARLVGLLALAVLGLLSVATGSVVVLGSTLVGGLVLLLVLRPGHDVGRPGVASVPVGPPATESDPQGAGAVAGRLRAFTSYASRSWESSIAMSLLGMDVALLAMVVSPAQLGYYAVAVAVADVPGIGFGATTQLLLARSRAESRAGELNARAARAIGLVVGLIATVGIVLAPAVIPLAFGSAFSAAVVPAQILLVSAVFEAVMQQHGTGLLALGSPRSRTKACIPALVLFVPVVALAGHAGGAIGAAIGVTAVRLVAAAVMAVVFARQSGVGLRASTVPTRQEWRDVFSLASVIMRRSST